MISNLLLLASAIYIYVDAMRMRSQRLHFVKKFAFMFLQSWSSISYARRVAVTGAWTKLHLFLQPSKCEVFLARWVQEVDLQVLLHYPLLNNTNLSLIISACDILVQMQGLCGHPTKTCLSGNVK